MTKVYKELQLVIDALIQKLDALSLANAELKKRLSKYEIPKNSNNSSIPQPEHSFLPYSG
jgi:regulator of replication initiation timing